jgi:murein L,D-transpeptidase YafK
MYPLTEKHWRSQRSQHPLWAMLLGLFCFFAVDIALAAADSPWVMVDTQQRTLTVLSEQGGVLEHFPYVSLGRNGAAKDRLHGDRKTPLGTFRIAWINPDSRFTLFFGLDFPTVEHADRAYREHIIDRDTYHSVLDAALEQHVPPQNTVLGGRIGIHGLGDKDQRFHYADNWTDGCVALTNQEIKKLAHWLHIGTQVVIY